MRLIVVSGLSGSGKSVALRVLEDLGYFCVDNLPAALLQPVIDEIATSEEETPQMLAVGIDARTAYHKLESLPEQIARLREQDVQTEILFLQADDDILLQRYSQTRRRHPLQKGDTTLNAAIDRERELLAAMINAANLVIDTSGMSVYTLADMIRERIDRRKLKSLSIMIESFGFKSGIPADADFVFDVRCLPNPYWTTELRNLTGRDPEVVEFLESQPAVAAMFEDIVAFLRRRIPENTSVNRNYLTVAVGCTGGQHRSVYMVDKIAEALSEEHEPVVKRHQELDARTAPQK
jgi:UPF0042 nucleotide-binding protein